jgi:raffinose/stachyose/melibiose transport system substrate-binding protein
VQNKAGKTARCVGILALLSTMGIVAIGASQGAATASSAKPAAHRAAPTTIQEWNWDTVADEPAENATLPVAIKIFDKQYNVKVDNDEMTLEEQNDKLPLAFSTKSSAPTVSQTNEGFGSMGRLVTDKELLALTNLNKANNWYSKVGKLSVQFNSFTSNGKTFGVGICYGIPDAGSLVGIYYNKKMLAAVGGAVPTNWSIFTKDLALLKKHGKVALAYAQGNPTAYQPVHTLYTIATSASRRSTPRASWRQPRSSRTGPRTATSPRDTRGFLTLRRSASSRPGKPAFSSKVRGTRAPFSRASGTTQASGSRRSSRADLVRVGRSRPTRPIPSSRPTGSTSC